METITTTEFFEISKKDAISIIKIKNNVFDFISDIDLSGKLMDFLNTLSGNTEIKALVFYNDPDCVNETNYARFSKRFMTESKKTDHSLTLGFNQKNVRFREITMLNRFVKTFSKSQYYCCFRFTGFNRYSFYWLSFCC